MTDLSNVTNEQKVAIRQEFADQMSAALKGAAQLLYLADLTSDGTRGHFREARTFLKVSDTVQKHVPNLPDIEQSAEERERAKANMAQIQDAIVRGEF